jgi:hypothetical protein
LYFAFLSKKSDNDEDYAINRPSKNSMRTKTRKCVRTNVLFKDDLNESLHDLHKKVRDISFEQEKMSDKLDCEKRYCFSETKKNDEIDSDVKASEFLNFF